MTNPFGLTLSLDTARQIVHAAVQHVPDGVALVVTPNIDHIAALRRSPALALAYRNATRVVCDGWPVQSYARWCGLDVARVTGCEIISELMWLAPAYDQPHRMFFVVDSVQTRIAVQMWARGNQRHLLRLRGRMYSAAPDYAAGHGSRGTA
jgi:N-acetylglucosaminyldiphosphoundecaprenol N-acetyl-beta-D-mannosaminyltransferase